MAVCKLIGIKWHMGCGRVFIPQQIDENLNHSPIILAAVVTELQLNPLNAG